MGREDEGVSSTRPEMVALEEYLEDHDDKIRLLYLAASGMQPVQSTIGGLFDFRRAAFLAQLRSKVGSTLLKVAGLRVNLNIDDTSITSRTHTHPSHSQTSRLLTSSLSLGVPVPRPTECIRDV